MTDGLFASRWESIDSTHRPSPPTSTGLIRSLNEGGTAQQTAETSSSSSAMGTVSVRDLLDMAVREEERRGETKRPRRVC